MWNINKYQTFSSLRSVSLGCLPFGKPWDSTQLLHLTTLTSSMQRSPGNVHWQGSLVSATVPADQKERRAWLLSHMNNCSKSPLNSVRPRKPLSSRTWNILSSSCLSSPVNSPWKNTRLCFPEPKFNLLPFFKRCLLVCLQLLFFS